MSMWTFFLLTGPAIVVWLLFKDWYYHRGDR
jgi:hypothetical protein